MHELALAADVIDTVCRRAGGARVIRVQLEVGKLAAVLPDAIRFCFDLASEGTAAEGARLEILEVAGRARCRQCSGELELERAFGRCACGSSDLEWLSGEQLTILEMEVA